MKVTRFFVAAMCAAVVSKAAEVDNVDTVDVVDVAAAKPAAKANPFGFERSAFDSEQPMVITSNRFEFDHKQMVAIFDEQVKVTHPQFYLEADQVFVFLDDANETKKNELKNILAQGNVVMTNENRRAVCDWALYTRAEDTLVMRANEGKFAQLTRGGESATGYQITFRIGDEWMEIIKSPDSQDQTVFVISPETLRPGGAKKEPKETPPAEDTPVDPEKPAAVKPALYIDPEAAL